MLKNLNGYFQLLRSFNPRFMLINIYASFICFRKVTSAVGTNPMDYMFASKPISRISTRYGFGLFLKLHHYLIANSVMKLSSSVISVTHNISTAVSDANELDIIAAQKEVRELHDALDVFIAQMPKNIESDTTQLAYKLIDSASLTNRMKYVLSIQENTQS